MPHYVIELPEGLNLLVGVNDYPVEFKIVFPNEKAVEFSFDAAPEPHSTVTVAPVELDTEKTVPHPGASKPTQWEERPARRNRGGNAPDRVFKERRLSILSRRPND
jgi:hypothetical protein